MLRVTVNKNDSVEIWELEGKLSGEWAKELERCWKERTPQAGVTVQVHLKAVSYIDAAGKQLLAEMHGRGIEIKGCGCMARAVVEEIVKGIGAKDSFGPSKKILITVLVGVCVLGGAACLAAREKSSASPSVVNTTHGVIGTVSNVGIK